MTTKTKKEIMREVAREIFSPFAPYSMYMIENKERFAVGRAQGFVSNMLREPTYSGYQAERLNEVIEAMQELIERSEQTLAALRDVRDQIEAAPDKTE